MVNLCYTDDIYGYTTFMEVCDYVRKTVSPRTMVVGEPIDGGGHSPYSGGRVAVPKAFPPFNYPFYPAVGRICGGYGTMVSATEEGEYAVLPR